MSSGKVNVDQLANELLKDLDLYRDATVEIVKNAVDRSAKETVEDLRQTSPRDSGAYAASWDTKKEKTSKLGYSRVVYNKEHYRLTHLLENGHAKVNGGRVAAKPHIADAEQLAMKNLELYIRQGIQNNK